jgi:hypothetical protein
MCCKRGKESATATAHGVELAILLPGTGGNALSIGRAFHHAISLSFLEANERGKKAIQIDQPVEIDHNPHQNHHDACSRLNFTEMRLEPLQEPTHLIEAETEQ